MHTALRVYFTILFLFLGTVIYAQQQQHPHIMVNAGDKPAILEKIARQPWAKKVVEEMEQKVAAYVTRHKTDPEWILSRYIMNRAPGKRYTDFYSDEDGTELVRYSGDAPYPTVRVSSHKRAPTTSDGYAYKAPTIAELVPYDTSMTMLLQSTAPGGKKERTNPQTLVEKLNGQINQLVLDAAIIYWLTGKEEYGTFAADVLTQWARGASYQNPIEGACRTGFLSIQSLGDGNYEPLPLAYDFLYDFLRQKKYETYWYENVFEKIAHTMTFKGLWNNNWFAAETPALVFAALSLENKVKRDYYLDYYLNKDTINKNCGQLALPSAIKQWLTPDGHWKEPGGYHNFPVSSLLISAVAMEKNGYNIFGKHPALLQASYVMLKYSFPNFNAPSIGDTGPVTQSAETLELGLLMAGKYNDPVFQQLAAAMEVLITQKGYKRETADNLGLLTYLPEIPSASKQTYTWPRSGQLDFAKAYLQRNGTSKEDGLMYVVQGATYNHNHANGMSMELYGAGMVMGPDPGKGITYEAPMHVKYYAQWAAHNTVVAGGVSSSVPYFKGGGGTKQMGEIKLAAMEPLADKHAVSPYCSFTDTRYIDKATGAPQQRTMAIIRTSPTSGYYVDIYRSGNASSNEYVYHNVGNNVELLTAERNPIALQPSPFPISKKPFDPPGFSLIKDYQSTGVFKENLVALFTAKANAGAPKYMQVLFTGEEGRTFYTGQAPPTATADVAFRNLPTPTLISRQQGEAWKRPFVALFEPFSGEGNATVKAISLNDRSQPGSFTALNVDNANGSRQIILQGLNTALYKKAEWSFSGSFGVVGLEQEKLSYLYLGKGNSISYGNYGLTAKSPGAAHLEINNNTLLITCNQATIVRITGAKANTVVLSTASNKQTLAVTAAAGAITFTVPAVTNATIQLQ